MLVITRKLEESIIIADNIEVTVLEVGPNRVKLGIDAPKSIKVIRNELIEAQNTNRESAGGKFSQETLKKFRKFALGDRRLRTAEAAELNSTENKADTEV